MPEPTPAPEARGPAERLPLNVRLPVASFALLVMVIGLALWGERQAGLYAAAARRP
jgi:hypothetical protein